MSQGTVSKVAKSFNALDSLDYQKLSSSRLYRFRSWPATARDKYVPFADKARSLACADSCSMYVS